MGSFATSLHVKSNDASRVASTLAEILAGKGWRPTEKTPDTRTPRAMPSDLRALQVSDPQNSWVSILDTDLMGAHSLAPAIAFVAWTLCGAAMGFMYPRFSVSVLEQSRQEAQGFNSAALTIGESLGAAVALAVTALVASVVGPGAFTAEFVVTVAIAFVIYFMQDWIRPYVA